MIPTREINPVIWYTFDNQPEPTENVISEDFDCTFESYDIGSTIGFANQLGGSFGVDSFGYKSGKSMRCSPDGSDSRRRIYKTTPVYQGEYFTVSGWCYSNTPGAYFSIEFNGGNYSWGVGQSRNYHSGNGWEWLQTSITSPATSNTTGYYFLRHSSSNIGDNIYWDNIQVEKKAYATPFIDGSRSGVVEDYSGNNNYSNLQSSTMPTWKSNSKLGTGAYEFSSYPQHIMSFTKTSQFNEFTYSCWVYRTVQQESMLILGNRFGNNTYISMSISGGDKLCLHKYHFNNNSDIDIASSSKTLGLNTWYHLVITYNNGETKSYVDGVLEGSGYHVNTSSDARYLQINYESNVNDTYRYFHGIIDDVRIYDTALTEQQVFQLYDQKTRVSIDKNGNFWAREFLNQDSSTPLSIGKTQNIKSGNEGNSTVSIRSDGIHANKIIRY